MKLTFSEKFMKSLDKIKDSRLAHKLEFWKDKYYKLKWTIWALKKYFKVVVQMRPWDYIYVLMMLKFQIEILSDHIKKHSLEIKKTKDVKIKNMEEFIKLANNHLEDNFAERCGYTYPEYVPEMYHNTLKRKESEEELREIFKNSYKLEKQEWNKMLKLLKDAKGWWE